MNYLEKKESILEILIISLWVFLAWLIWWIIILIISFFLWTNFSLFSWVYNTSKLWLKVEPIYPIVLSFITIFWTSITSILTYKILSLTNGEKYRSNNVIFTNISFFQVLVYLSILPVYIIYWWVSFDNIMTTYIFHVLIVIFWTHIILDVLNNYRYVMIWIYWSFIALFLSTFVSIIFFNLFTSWQAKLMSLVFLLPIINFLIIFIKKLFELLYYYFYRKTWTDPIWDIFYKIKREDEELEKEEEQKNLI